MAHYEKADKSTPLKRATQNIINSSRGLKILFGTGTMRSLMPFVILPIAGIVVIGTWLISGEWFNPIELIILGSILSHGIITETGNTGAEIICDKITREEDDDIRDTKDVESAGVFISWIKAFLAGVLFAICHICHWPWWEYLTSWT